MQRRGFTLIELLVVIAIIAILAAILFPTFASAKKRAQMTKCIGNLKQLSSAFRMYADSYGGYMPNDWPPTTALPNNWCGCESAGGWVYLEKGQIWNYTKNRGIYMCPSDLGRKAINISSPGKDSKDYPLSYSMNHSVGNQVVDALSNSSKRMLLLHENRGESAGEFAMNDGTFVPNGQDYLSIVHYDGTTLVYVDGHAIWKSRKALLPEMFSYW